MAPKSAEQFDLMKKNAKDKIKKSAIYLFSRKGISIKVSEIAKHADISQGLLYRYYESKTDLIKDLVKTASKAAIETISGIDKAPISAKDKIEMISKMMVEMLESKDGGADMFLFMLQAYLNMSSELLEIYSWEDSPLSYLARIIGQGQSEGTVKSGDAIKLSCLYWSAVQGLCYYYAINSPVFPDSGMLAGILLK